MADVWLPVSEGGKKNQDLSSPVACALFFWCAANPEQQQFCLPLLRDTRAEEKLPGVCGALDRTTGGRA